MLIRGDRLKPETRAEVLRAYGYRWTHENETRARLWFGARVPTAPLVSDAEWLRTHAFSVRKDGKLNQRARFCFPAYMADGVDDVTRGWAPAYENDRDVATEAVKYALKDWQKTCRADD